MSNILQANAETFTRIGQIITVANKQEESEGLYFLAHKASRGKDTGFLCLPIQELSTEEACAARKNDELVVSLGDTPTNTTSRKFKGAANAANTVRHYKIDPQDAVIILDNGKAQTSKITKAIQPPERLGAILQQISNKVLTQSENGTVAAYRKVFTPEVKPVRGLTANYDRLGGDYGHDKVRGHIKKNVRHAVANANIRNHGTTEASSAPSAE